MNAEQLIELAHFLKEHRDFIKNEEAAKMSLVIPFIRHLGYNPNNPREVRPEYTAQFTQGDGKRYPDRMDFAIFDATGAKPLMVVETKPPGTDLKAKSLQLARYISQIPELHFGILTDGCVYQFYGDLESQNVMDNEPFFSFSLDDPKTDWVKVASFLSKFSRNSFNADTLITDAENSRYRQAMTDKLAAVLRDPTKDESFLKWVISGVYFGKITIKVMARMKELVCESIEPALLRAMSDEFLEKLKKRIQDAQEQKMESTNLTAAKTTIDTKPDKPLKPSEPEEKPKAIIATEEELKFFEIVKDICKRAGYDENKIMLHKTINYCSVSFEKTWKWLIRYFGFKRKFVTTLIPIEELSGMVKDFEVGVPPKVFGVSRFFINDVEQLKDIEAVVIRSMEILMNKS